MNEAIKTLRKYKRPMDVLYWFFFAFTIITEFLRSTLMLNMMIVLGMRALAFVVPHMSVSTANLIFSLILDLPFLILIPALYVIAAEMKSMRERLVALLLLVLGWFYTIHMQEWNDGFMFRVLLLIVASYGKDFKKIAKVSIVIISACLLLSMALSIAKVIPEYNLERNGKIRHSFGIYSPVGFAGHITVIILMVIFLRNGLLRWMDYLAIAILMIFNAIFIDGRAPLLTTLLATFGSVIYSIATRGKWKIPEKIMNPVRRILACSYPIIAGIYFLMMMLYSEKDAFYHHIPFLSTYEGWIAVPHRLIGEIGISVFGNYMQYYAEAEHSLVQNGIYNFLDSSYSRMLMIYGVVGLLLTLWIFTKIQCRLKNNKQTFRMYLMLVLALNYVVERFLMDPMYNVFVLLFFAAIPEAEEKEVIIGGEKLILKKPFYVGTYDAEGNYQRVYTGVDMWEVYRRKPILYKAVKRLGDIVGSLCALIVLSPVFLAATIAIKREDKGPAFYSGKRFGKDMKIFPMHKFRSMCVKAEEMTNQVIDEKDKNGLAFKIKDDPRITKVGAFLRRTCIDEIPQFWNVLKGEMSLVGPRPIQTTDKEIEDYEKQRWAVKPGITCFWQACGRHNVPWEEWVDMDLKYIDEMSILTDLMLLWSTADAVVDRSGWSKE